MIYIRLYRVLVVQVDDADFRIYLPQAVDAADALLDAHRIPGHIVVDQGAAELEVQALGRRIRTNHDLGEAIAKALLGGFPGDDLPVAGRGPDFTAAAGEADDAGAEGRGDPLAQKVHGVGVLGEDHRLAIALTAQLGQDL